MHVRARFCDLCICNGTLEIATHHYKGDVQQCDACEEHAEEVEGYGLNPIPHVHPGDVDPLDL